MIASTNGVWLSAAALFLMADPYAAPREKMVREQIEARGVQNPEALRAMRSVPRHLFVPERLRSYAYSDQPLPIGLGQTISQPYIVALMTELLAPGKTDRVLEIGTGSGYQAAVLAMIVKHVYTIEIVPELAKSAGERLTAQGYQNISVRKGDGYKGWPEQAPFDRIILTAAPPEIPQALIDQLVRGGRLVAPVGDLRQELVVLEKTARGEIRRRSVAPVMFVPMVPQRAARIPANICCAHSFRLRVLPEPLCFHDHVGYVGPVTRARLQCYNFDQPGKKGTA